MTILIAGAVVTQPVSSSTTIAIAGIVSGAVVIGILGVAFAITMNRRSPKNRLTHTVVESEDVAEVKNPIRVIERQRSMTYPTEQEVQKPPPNVMKNPFAARAMSSKFSPTLIRMSDYPPPPPPLEV
jgi:hypothetical protein